jgi:hypothetical protein
MARSRNPVAQKRRGRPATGQDPVTAIRLSPKLRKSVDAWASRQSDRPTRSEAIRRLIEQALAEALSAGQHGIKAASASRAEKMAAKQIDRMLEHSDQPNAVKAKRKKRLLRGPPEFRKK